MLDARWAALSKPDFFNGLLARIIHELVPPVRARRVVARKTSEQSGGGAVAPSSICERAREAGGSRRLPSDAATARFVRAGGASS